jgi:hypothetical protein
MAEVNLYKDTPIAPQSLNGKSALDVSLKGKRHVIMQFDAITNPSYRLYFRVDESAEPQGSTLAGFAAEGYLSAGGTEDIWIDPDTSETPYLHLLLVTSSGVVANGGASDNVLLYAERHNAD